MAGWERSQPAIYFPERLWRVKWDWLKVNLAR